jgi:hypothetical protein
MQAVSPFQGIVERDKFLALFPHRYDYIYAPHSDPGEKPQWLTESRYPLSDRHIQQGAYLYGVRFDTDTQYVLLDIDIQSAYHPSRDPFAISRIKAALEPLGLLTDVTCTSSYSGGLHLYFPFARPCRSWKIAAAVKTSLEQAGFKITPGQLELFPDAKPYTSDQPPALFNAHRLPLQIGSYLVNEDFQPILGDRPQFIRQWQFAQSRNLLDVDYLERVLRQSRKRQTRLSQRADKFLNDLNAEIEQGWTDFGQTNRLLGRITMRCYIFHHILEGGIPLTGQALVDAIVEMARSLPGYQDYCRHQHEIEHRAMEWARCIENSHYYPYGTQKGMQRVLPLIELPKPSWNEQRSQDTRCKIRQAIAQMLETNTLPSTITNRFKALLDYGIGGSSLYKHRDLWHPDYLQLQVGLKTDLQTGLQKPLDLGAQSIQCTEQARPKEEEKDLSSSTSLFVQNDGNSSVSKGFGDRTDEQRPAVSNSLNDPQVFLKLLRVDRDRLNQQFVSQAEKMQRYLHSGDPILVAEAKTWAAAYSISSRGDWSSNLSNPTTLVITNTIGNSEKSP